MRHLSPFVSSLGEHSICHREKPENQVIALSMKTLEPQNELVVLHAKQSQTSIATTFQARFELMKCRNSAGEDLPSRRSHC